MGASGTIHPVIAGTAAWQRAVREYVERLRHHYRNRLVAVVLYGSRARGDADAVSDIDVLVVLRGGIDPRAEQRTVSELRHEVQEQYDDLLLCPVAATEHDYRHRMLPLFMNIRREGIEVWPQGTAAREDQERYGTPGEELLQVRRRMNDALDDAKAGLAQGRYEWAANRSYYAMFHAATALLLAEGLSFSRHSGVISAFNQRFVRTGRFAGELAPALSMAFELRNKADYGYGERIAEDEASEVVQRASAFVKQTGQLLNEQ